MCLGRVKRSRMEKDMRPFRIKESVSCVFTEPGG